jgi:hypothetical protein
MKRIVRIKLSDKDRSSDEIDWKKVNQTTEADINRHEAEDETAWQQYLAEKAKAEKAAE